MAEAASGIRLGKKGSAFHQLWLHVKELGLNPSTECKRLLWARYSDDPRIKKKLRQEIVCAEIKECGKQIADLVVKEKALNMELRRIK